MRCRRLHDRVNCSSSYAWGSCFFPMLGALAARLLAARYGQRSLQTAGRVGFGVGVVCALVVGPSTPNSSNLGTFAIFVPRSGPVIDTDAFTLRRQPLAECGRRCARNTRRFRRTCCCCSSDVAADRCDWSCLTSRAANCDLEPPTELTPEPTLEPTLEPTAEPTPEPTLEPTAEPTPEPTAGTNT